MKQKINIAKVKALITNDEHTQEKFIITKRNQNFNDFRLDYEFLFNTEIEAENTISTWAFINRDNFRIEKIIITGCDIKENINSQTTFVGLWIEDNTVQILGVTNYFGFYKIVKVKGMNITHALDFNLNDNVIFITKSLFEKLFNIEYKTDIL